MRTHRCALFHGGGPSQPPLDPSVTERAGPLLALRVQPPMLTIGGAAIVTLQGEAGDVMGLVGAFDIRRPFAIPGLEQPGYGVGAWDTLGLRVGDGTGAAAVTLAVPVNPSLRGLTLYVRGVDLTRLPLQASPIAGIVVH